MANPFLYPWQREMLDMLESNRALTFAFDRRRTGKSVVFDIETIESILPQLDAADSESAREYLAALKIGLATDYGQSSVPPSPFPGLAQFVAKPQPEPPPYRNGIINRHNRRKSAKIKRK